MRPYPYWLLYVSWTALSVAFVCTVLVLVDIKRRPQKMAVMNVVWPITALYWGPVAVWAYFRAGVKSSKAHVQRMQERVPAEQIEKAKKELKQQEATRTQVALATSHCGAGCTVGDIIGDTLVAAGGLAFLGGVLPTRLAMDFAIAWVAGVVFQYFTIVPMRGLPVGKGIAAAIKADTVSIVAFQIGMAVWMVLTYFVVFPYPHLHAADPVFWFMMQLAMIVGYFTSYPANRWLVAKGLKERMPEQPDAARALDNAA